MIRKYIRKELREIGEGIRDLPINLLLLGLATLKAVLNETQSQLLAILSSVVAAFYGLKAGITLFIGAYTLLYFIVDKLNSLLASKRPPTNNQ